MDISRLFTDSTELAYDDGSVKIAFAQLNTLTQQVISYLLDSGVKKHSTVFFSLSSHLNYIFNFASLRLGIRHGIYNKAIEGLDLENVIVFASAEQGLISKHRTVGVSKKALFEIASLEPSAVNYQNGSRISFTSGSTGIPKAFEFSTEELFQRAQLGNKYWSDIYPRMFLLGQATLPGQYLSLIAAQDRLPYLAPTKPAKNLKLILDYQVRSIMASPNQLIELISLRGKMGVKLPLEQIQIAGGAISGSLAKRIGDDIELVNYYASSEAGPVGVKRNFNGEDTIINQLADDIELQIVDENNTPQPINTPGLIRYKRSPMTTSYLSAEEFTDGFFYPGDRGLVNADGHLQLLGRDGEVQNIGGLKIDLRDLEKHLEVIHEIKDQAAFFFENTDGIKRLGLAVVIKGDQLEVLEKIKKQLGEKTPNVIMELATIPRGSSGKVLVEQLREKAASSS